MLGENRQLCPRPEACAELNQAIQVVKECAMKFRPLHDRVLAQRIEEGEEKIGGIVIPDTAKEKPQKAKVVAVGDGKMLKDGKRAALDVKVGDEVLVGKWSGTEVKIDGEEYLVLREDEILAVLG
jgi:chaperonin GroES